MMSGLLPPLSSRDLGRCLTPSCCCSASLDRCDRCDLLVGLEGFHLMGVARPSDALVLDVESCNQLVGCPGCGLNRTRPRSRGGGGDRRALGRGPGADPMAQYGARYAANAPAKRCHSWSAARRCAHPGHIWVCGRSAGRSDSCASREPLSLVWLDTGSHGIPRSCQLSSQTSDDQHCMRCTTRRSNGKISIPNLPTDARLRLIVQPAPAPAGSGLDLYEELNGDLDHVQATEVWHQD